MKRINIKKKIVFIFKSPERNKPYPTDPTLDTLTHTVTGFPPVK